MCKLRLEGGPEVMGGRCGLFLKLQCGSLQIRSKGCEEGFDIGTQGPRLALSRRFGALHGFTEEAFDHGRHVIGGYLEGLEFLLHQVAERFGPPFMFGHLLVDTFLPGVLCGDGLGAGFGGGAFHDLAGLLFEPFFEIAGLVFDRLGLFVDPLCGGFDGLPDARFEGFHLIGNALGEHLGNGMSFGLGFMDCAPDCLFGGSQGLQGLLFHSCQGGGYALLCLAELFSSGTDFFDDAFVHGLCGAEDVICGGVCGRRELGEAAEDGRRGGGLGPQRVEERLEPVFGSCEVFQSLCEFCLGSGGFFDALRQPLVQGDQSTGDFR